ncbi:MAG: hypothetical protein OHK0023_04610 [Anaerolineae bacterium]
MRSPVYPDMDMVSVMIEGIALDQCVRSGGYWLDRGELARLAQREMEEVEALLRQGRTIERLIHETSRLCPRDGTPLQQLEFPGYASLKIDVCPMCGGIWLDAREISQALTLLDLSADDQNKDKPQLTGGVLRFLQHLLGESGQA